ncbi:hypothetical protein [Streptomyces longwoodensis]|uniref:hypothetical protein n=1 Tax=Streptomyces longwoodensis TaxID=68231 RepID=UPI0038140C92
MNVVPAGRRCFYISPIGAEGSDIRRRSDQILRHIIKPATAECGYEAIRADEIDSSGMISTQVIDRILADELVVADLTDQNPNVFYELAVRHATRKPFIHIIAKGQDIPFDVQGMRTIEVDHRDLDSAAAARESIVRTIRAIEGGERVDTPMTFTLNLQDLRNSDKAEERGVADILEIVKSLQRQMSRSTRDTEAQDLSVMRGVIAMWVMQGHLSRDSLLVLMGELNSGTNKQWLQNLLNSASSGGQVAEPRIGAVSPNESDGW